MFRTKRSRDRNVVLVKRTVDLGCWEFGIGRVWGGDEKGEVSLRATWDQGGQGRITPKEGFQVSKRGIKREVNGELARGVKKGSCAITCVVNLYICI
jgi:hypothetical protein